MESPISTGYYMDVQGLSPLLRARDVIKLIGRGKSWLDRERRKGNFPQPVRCNDGRSVSYTRESVLRWIESLQPVSAATQK
jgi:predicted DNA-binding transcriptional regulator AlpA